MVCYSSLHFIGNIPIKSPDYTLLKAFNCKKQCFWTSHYELEIIFSHEAKTLNYQTASLRFWVLYSGSDCFSWIKTTGVSPQNACDAKQEMSDLLPEFSIGGCIHWVGVGTDEKCGHMLGKEECLLRVTGNQGVSKVCIGWNGPWGSVQRVVLMALRLHWLCYAEIRYGRLCCAELSRSVMPDSL